jgi:hypothetical protein
MPQRKISSHNAAEDQHHIHDMGNGKGRDLNAAVEMGHGKEFHK